MVSESDPANKRRPLRGGVRAAVQLRSGWAMVQPLPDPNPDQGRGSDADGPGLTIQLGAVVRVETDRQSVGQITAGLYLDHLARFREIGRVMRIPELRLFLDVIE